MPEISEHQFGKALKEYRESNTSENSAYKGCRFSITSEDTVADRGNVIALFKGHQYFRANELGIDSSEIDGNPVEVTGVIGRHDAIILASLTRPDGTKKYYSHDDDI